MISAKNEKADYFMVNKIDNFRSVTNTIQIENNIKISPRPFETSKIESCVAESSCCCGWFDSFYQTFVDYYTYCRTQFMRFKGWLGLGPKLAIPEEHPCKKAIEDLIDLGSGIFNTTLRKLFWLISNRHKHIHVDTDFLGKLVVPANLDPKMLKAPPENASLVFIPLFIQCPGNHFTVIAVDLKRKTVEYNDSEAGKVGRWFLEAVKRHYFPNDARAKILVNNKRAQWDNHSCGVHALDFTKRRARGESFEQITKNPTSTSDIEDLRIRFAKDLLYAKPWVLRRLKNL